MRAPEGFFKISLSMSTLFGLLETCRGRLYIRRGSKLGRELRVRNLRGLEELVRGRSPLGYGIDRWRWSLAACRLVSDRADRLGPRAPRGSPGTDSAPLWPLERRTGGVRRVKGGHEARAPTRAGRDALVEGRKRMFGRRRKALEERIAAAIRAEFDGIMGGLEKDRREHLRSRSSRKRPAPTSKTPKRKGAL
jgi:hypothetical protein